jgi:hypothetical protein
LAADKHVEHEELSAADAEAHTQMFEREKPQKNREIDQQLATHEREAAEKNRIFQETKAKKDAHAAAEKAFAPKKADIIDEHKEKTLEEAEAHVRDASAALPAKDVAAEEAALAAHAATLTEKQTTFDESSRIRADRAAKEAKVADLEGNVHPTLLTTPSDEDEAEKQRLTTQIQQRVTDTSV